MGEVNVFPICLFCRTLGTPTEANWPGVTELPDYKPTFPKWAPKSLKSLLPKLADTGLDLLKVSTSCRLKHAYTGDKHGPQCRLQPGY